MIKDQEDTHTTLLTSHLWVIIRFMIWKYGKVEGAWPLVLSCSFCYVTAAIENLLVVFNLFRQALVSRLLHWFRDLLPEIPISMLAAIQSLHYIDIPEDSKQEALAAFHPVPKTAKSSSLSTSGFGCDQQKSLLNSQQLQKLAKSCKISQDAVYCGVLAWVSVAYRGHNSQEACKTPGNKELPQT